MASTGMAALSGRLAGRYDAWYDGPAGAAVLSPETQCLRPLLAGLLALARSRGVRVRGAGDRITGTHP